MAQTHLHPEIQEALNLHIKKALERMSQPKYRQEPNYMVTLIGKLDGVVYDGVCGKLELIGVPVDDRGRGAAESITGADFALSAVIATRGVLTTKAVLGQAKGGNIDHLSTSERNRLDGQTRKMRARTNHYVIVETPVAPMETVVVRRSVSSNPRRQYAGQTLTDYLELMVTCRHGDIRKTFTSAVLSDSSLSQLKVSYTAP